MKTSAKSKILSLLLAAAMVFTLLPTSAAAEATSVPYIDENGDTQTTASAEIVTADTATLGSGWYVVIGSVYHMGTIAVSGDAHLILADGAELEIHGDVQDAGIRVTGDNSLTIYGQAAGTGLLDARGGGDGTNGGGAGIGGAYQSPYTVGDITINGGTVYAFGGAHYESGVFYTSGAGIGGGATDEGGTVNINGGVVYAIGGPYAAGIGGGTGVTGEGGTVTITGGTVQASGGTNAAGIGGGLGADGGDVIISGGTVLATGGGGSAQDIGHGNGSGFYRGTIKNPQRTAVGHQAVSGDALAGLQVFHDRLYGQPWRKRRICDRDARQSLR